MKNKLETHEHLAVNTDIKGSSNRAFGVVFVVVFLIVGFWPLLEDQAPRIWALIIATSLSIFAVFFPSLLAPFNLIWMKFGLLLHRIVNPIVMGLIFFLTVMPTGLIMRALRKDPLSVKLDKSLKTYWIVRNPPGPEAGSMNDQF